MDITPIEHMRSLDDTLDEIIYINTNYLIYVDYYSTGRDCFNGFNHQTYGDQNGFN